MSGDQTQLLKIFRKSPFIRLLLFYAAGLITALYVRISTPWVLTILLLGLGFVVIILLPLKIYRHFTHTWIFGIIVSAILFMAGMMHGCLENISGEKAMKIAGSRNIFLVQIIEQPEIKTNSVKAVVRISKILEHEEVVPCYFKALLYIEKDSASLALFPGAFLRIQACFNLVSSPQNPGEFDYRKYMAARKIYLQGWISTSDWCPDKKVSGIQIKSLANRSRNKLLASYRQLNLKPNEYATLSALTLGYRSELDPHTKNIFTRAGVMHVMALSGFNVAVIALLLSFLFKMLNGSFTGRIIRTIITLILIWAFALITGMSASVTRATVMLSFVLMGGILGKKVNTYNILFVSAFAMLAVSPALITDVSFQLSFAAVLGIIFFQPVLFRRLIIKSSPAKRIWQLFTVSCAAQLGTFPVSIYYFHQFPIFFWLTNLYVIPLVTLIIYLACAYFMLSLLKPLAWLVGKILAGFVQFLLLAVGFIEKIPFALADGLHLTIIQVIILIMIVFLLGSWLSGKKSRSFQLALILLSILDLTGIINYYKQERQRSIIVNNLKDISSVNLIAKNTNILLVSPDTLITSSGLAYSFDDCWTEKKVYHHARIIDPDKKTICSQDIPGVYIRQHFLGDNLYLEFYGKSLVVLNNDSFQNKKTSEPLNTDLIVISGSFYPDTDAILHLFNVNCLVIDSSVGSNYAWQWTEACNKSGIPCWNVAARGAYELEF